MELDFDKMNGLVPAIIQDNETRKVLMLGFMNKEAYDKADFKNKKWYSPTVCFESYNKYYLGKRVQTFDELITLIANRVDCHLTEEDNSFLMKAFWDSYDNGIDLVAEIKKRIQC